MTTPIEQAQAALDEAEQRATELRHAVHHAKADISAAMLGGTIQDLEHLHLVHHESITSHQRQLGMITQARDQLQRAENALVAARNQVKSLRAEAARREKARAAAQEQADSQERLRDSALATLSDAESHLAALEPSEPIAPVVAPEPRPAPQGPVYQQPARVVGVYQPRYFDAAGREVNADGSPLAL